ncbi:MAG TPA: methyltransferase domain-containing protein [Phycisphaerae bacterium]|jgi:ubiquinone/menaquinone biosynthesis C-methylase UbiE
MSKWLADLLWKLWYPYLTRLAGSAPVSFLNYGYVDDSPPIALEPEDEPDRACIQLYHRVAGAADLQGLDVLEVSCGHGGGASYVARYLGPRSMCGIDRNARAVRLCRERHGSAGVTFSVGDAQGLNFAGGSFDAVINVEASHCYPNIERFFGEVVRVLRPGGHFLYADFRETNPHRAILEWQLKESGLEVVRADDITANVLRGMRANTQKYRDLVGRLVPRLLRKAALSFAGVEGSAIYKELETEKTCYLAYHLRKALMVSPE